MKIVALMFVKNEVDILPYTIPPLRQLVDDVLVLDTGSTDETVPLLKSLNVRVRHGEGGYGAEGLPRNQLLQWAREVGASHHVWLDADECFTANLTRIALRSLAGDLTPGRKLAFEWITLWHSFHAMRHDDVWWHLHKDFIFCDDGLSQFTAMAPHTSRTPETTAGNLWTTVSRKKAAVLHFQFVDFASVQVKQAWYRCLDFLRGDSALAVNERYSITMDGPHVRTKPVPDTWLEGLSLPTGPLQSPPWRLAQILQLFDQNGIATFEPLEIWHVPELLATFESRMGRAPRPPLRRRTRGLRRIVRSVLRRIDSLRNR
jgi:hypothetical protein